MRLKSIELSGFKSFAKKTALDFGASITSVVGPNGSGKSNVAESFRFVLGEQSMKSMRGRKGEDLIWNGSSAVPRAGRAGVRLTFDNSDRALNLDFDEVTLERVVHRDGGNDYLLNGSQVRLRDIAELLAQANIGASGHHIISQGEADRVLSAGSRERREMIEDALGLTAYLYKREEAEKKLEKTGENMREVESLRRELSPHLKFLQSQVKKIEEAHKLRDDLAQKYMEYLKRESVYLRVTKTSLMEEREAPEREHKQVTATIAHLREELSATHGKDAGTQELMRLETEGRTARERRDSLSRELGRIEGKISAEEHIHVSTRETIPAAQARSFAERMLRELEGGLAEGVLEKLRTSIASLLEATREFLHSLEGTRSDVPKEDLTDKKAEIEKELTSLQAEEQRISKAVEALRKKIESEKDASREAEHELFKTMARRSELEGVLAGLSAKIEMLSREQEHFKYEAGEAGALIGHTIGEYESFVVRDSEGGEVSENEIASEPRSGQEDRRRKVERLKIKLEESGAGNANEVMKEFQETSERDAFLERELADLTLSAEKLRELIGELTATLEERFKSGIDKINKEFEEFFKLMFGGGQAALSIVKEKKLKRAASSGVIDADEESDEEDVEVEEGVEVSLSLPHKRIKGLHMLSGGERALTSIALIFAMSQVNPPPFLILDETDAALDEANSRRYGDLIEKLAKHSQLIVITHNRETMSRAGILYGITMGQDGVSKLLSVKFEEALAVAK